MKNITRKTGLLLTAAALFAFSGTTISYAQGYRAPDQQTQRMNQLEKQIQTLSRTVYRGAPPPVNAGNFASNATSKDNKAVAGLEIRLGQIEQQQRRLTGDIEKVTYQNTMLKERLDKIQRDYEARLISLENGRATTTGTRAGSSTYNTQTAVDNSYTPPSTSSFRSAGRTLGTVYESGNKTSPDSLYESAFTDIRETRYGAAEKKFRTFIASYPRHTLTPNAQYWLAETFYVRGEYQDAAKMFAQGYQDHPKSAKAADSLLKLGLSLSRIGRTDDACLSLQQLKKEFPGESTPTNRRATQELQRLRCG